MGNSLQDELLKAGLVDKGRVEKVKRQSRQQARQQRKGKAEKAAAKQAPRQATPAELEKRARDRELEQQRAEVRRQREVAAEVRQLVRNNRLPRAERDDDLPFHFDNKGKIKRIFVSPEVQQKITTGKLVIVNDNGVFELVPPAIAERIRQRNPSLVIDLPKEQGPDADDPYADFKVPDDLMW